jgi:hypothetical protein
MATRVRLRLSSSGPKDAGGLPLSRPAPFACREIDQGTEEVAVALDVLLGGVTADNVHGGCDTGLRRGVEVW